MATRAKEPGVDFRDDQQTSSDAAALQHDLRESLVNQYPFLTDPTLTDTRYPERSVPNEQLFMTFKEVVQQPENDYETVRETALLIAENLQGEPAAKIQDLKDGNLNYSEVIDRTGINCPETYDAVVAAAANIANFRVEEVCEAIADALMSVTYYPNYKQLMDGNQAQELYQRLEQVAGSGYGADYLLYQDPFENPAMNEAILRYSQALQNHGAAQMQEIMDHNPSLDEKLYQPSAQDISDLGKAMLDYANEDRPERAIGLVEGMVKAYLERNQYALEDNGQDLGEAVENFRSELLQAYQEAAQERRNYTEALLAADTLRQGGYPTPEPGLADFDTETQQYREWAWMMYTRSASAVYHDMQHRFEQTGDDPEKMMFPITPMIADLSVRSLLRGLDDMATGETPPSEKYAPETYSDPNVAADFDQNARIYAAASAETIRQEISYLQHAAMRGDEPAFLDHTIILYGELAYASQIPASIAGIVDDYAGRTES